MKYLINRIFFIATACLCLPVVSCAQPGNAAKATQLALRFPAAEEAITQSLMRRVKNTYHPLVQLLSSSAPGQQFSKPFGARPADVYPDVPFLTTPQQLELYFIARNNRATQQMLTSTRQQLNTLYKNQRVFFSSCQRPTISPTQVPSWLAKQIPQKTDYLFLGEQHEGDEIKQTVVSFLPELKKRFAKRPIILFTEFLPEQQRWEGHPDFPHKNCLPVWQQAQALHIPVIGLEPQFVLDNSSIRLASSTPDNSENIWASLEGARIRNNRWAKTLAKYRKKYPDALFLIYSGPAHAYYSEAHSLGQQLQHLNTFVISLHPQHSQTPVLFDILTNEIFANQSILYIQNKNFSHVAGFDIQVKIPNQTEDAK